MNTELCFEIFDAKLREYKSLSNDTKYSLLRCSNVSINDIEIKTFNNEKIFDIILVNRFYQKAFVYLNELITDYKYNEKRFQNIDKFYESFAFSNKEFNIGYDEFYDIFNRIFKVNNGIVDLESFFGYFEGKKITFRIKNEEFLEISLNSIISEHAFLNTKLNGFFDFVDIKKQGIVFFNEFEELMSKIFLNYDSRWKNNEYFL